jgi:hypothetical protein
MMMHKKKNFQLLLDDENFTEEMRELYDEFYVMLSA